LLDINDLRGPRARKSLVINGLQLARFLNIKNGNLARFLLVPNKKLKKYLDRIEIVLYIKNMKQEILYILHTRGQKFIRRAHKAERDNKRFFAFVNFQLFNLCYNMREILR
jgi:hypothetical protein